MRASKLLNELYKIAQMEVPSEEEKKTMHVPEQAIDRPVSKEKKLLEISSKRQ